MVSPKFAQVDRYVVIRAHADAFHAHPAGPLSFRAVTYTPQGSSGKGFLGVRSADGAVFHADFHWGSLGVQPSKAANGTKEVTKGAPLKHEAQHSERTMMPINTQPVSTGVVSVNRAEQADHQETAGLQPRAAQVDGTQFAEFKLLGNLRPRPISYRLGRCHPG